MGRPTVHDIAKSAGVSLATVDRVLNNRPGVREKTIQQVNQAISQLEYVRDVAAANLARGRTYNFVCVFPDSQSEFIGEVKTAISEYALKSKVDRVNVSTRSYPPNNTNELVELLAELQNESVDGLAIMAPETPSVRDAVRRVVAAGITVTTFVSDLPSTDRAHFVGINNVGAGATAAKLLGRFLGREPGTILVVANSMTSIDQAERRSGFDRKLAESFPQHEVLPTLETFGNAQTAYERIDEALKSHGNISGIYSIGGGNKPLVKRLLEDGAAKELTVVAHELTDCSRAALIDGTFDAVIAQNVGHIVRSALRIMKAQADSLATIEGQERIRTEIFLAENLP